MGRIFEQIEIVNMRDIVLFRWKEVASQEAIDRALAELRKLKGKIPGIANLSCGANFSDRAKGYTHGLVMCFTRSVRAGSLWPAPGASARFAEFCHSDSRRCSGLRLRVLRPSKAAKQTKGNSNYEYNENV